jgi:hypothetical protein
MQDEKFQLLRLRLLLQMKGPYGLVFPKQNYNVLSPDFRIHVSVIDLYVPRICLPILLQPNRQTDPGNI